MVHDNDFVYKIYIFSIIFYKWIVSLSNELKSQDEYKKEKEKEILRDLDSVKSKANEVLQKLGNYTIICD